MKQGGCLFFAGSQVFSVSEKHAILDVNVVFFPDGI